MHILCLLLNCTDKKILVQRQYSRDEMNKFMAVPLVVPEELAAKPSKGRNKFEILLIISDHPSHGKLQEVILQKKKRPSEKLVVKRAEKILMLVTIVFEF